jgi:hypothetical protein
MVSAHHEGPLWLLRLWPTLVVDLLRRSLAAGGQPLVPECDEVAIASEDASMPLPIERRADLVLALRRRGQVVLQLVVEVQLRPNEDKRRRLPEDVAAVHGRGEGPVIGLFLCVDEPTARWARRPVESFQLHSPFVPLVLGPAEIPRILDEENARMAPEVTLLSGLVHARGPTGYESLRLALEMALGQSAAGGLSKFDLEM